MKTNLFGTVLRGRNIALVTLALSAMVTSAYADPVTVNGFQTSSTTSNELTTGASGGVASYSGATLTHWTNTNGYSFVFVPNDTSANSVYGTNNVTMWNNPFTGSGGGNIVALDSDYPSPTNTGSISQILNGLDAGGTVTITFGLALDQQNNKTNVDSTSNLVVSLGGQSQTLDLTYNGTTSWATETLTFSNVVGGSEALSFLADNGPEGGPSFVLLDNVGASQTPPPTVPEPGSLALLSTGLIGLGGLVRSRFKK